MKNKGSGSHPSPAAFFICAVYEKSFSSLKSEIIVHQNHVNPILMSGEACHQELTADGIR